MLEDHTSIRSLLKAALSVVLIAVFCFVPARMLYLNVNSSAGRQELHNPVTLSAPSNGAYGSAVQLSPAVGSEVCVLFEFLGFDPATSYANFGIVVGVNGPGAAQIKSTLSAKTASKYTPLLRITSNTGLTSITIVVPALVLLASDANTPCSQRAGQPYPGDGGYRVIQNIFLLGQPRGFPNDWYELNDTVALYICAPGDTQDGCAPEVNFNGTLQKPTQLPEKLIAITRDQDLTMTVATGVQGQLKFTIQRPTSFVVYTYWVACMPFFLMLGLFIAYAWRKKKKLPERKIPAVYEIVFGVAAALVAILPLRAVLVPSSLPSLTRLDILFGTGATLLVALSLAWVFIWTSADANDTSSGDAPAGRV